MPNNTQKSGQQGTGKHPHKDSEEPYPHTEQTAQHRASGSSATDGSKKGGSHSDSSSERSESADEKSREYRDAQGNIHHHTHTYEEQHKGAGGGKK